MKQLRTMQCGLVLLGSLLAGQSLAADKPAVLDWYQPMLLSTPMSGVVEQVYVSSGQRLKPKQKLLRLDSRGFRARVSKAEAVLSRATESHAEAKLEMERAQELFDRTAISVHDRELVRIEFAKAIANLKEAKAELVQAKLELEYSEIRAPNAGIVLQVFAHKGQTVVHRSQSKPLVAMASMDKMLARAHVSAEDLEGLKIGMRMDVRLQGQTLTGKVHRLGMEPVNPQQPPMYLLEVEFDTAAKSYRKGQEASIILP